ncbi:hypothetical protein Mapa_004982 [Marchantia paleacea]|nr:hypothetical protein Mapa_004982 [Marchantia paleacea]
MRLINLSETINEILPPRSQSTDMTRNYVTSNYQAQFRHSPLQYPLFTEHLSVLYPQNR